MSANTSATPQADQNIAVTPLGGVQRASAAPPTNEPPQTPPAAPDRPAWLPEKFKTPEDLAKAYSELEKKQSSAATPPPVTPDPNAPPADPNAAAAIKAVGLADFEAYSNEFSEKGELSAESYAALEKKGFSKELVDTYVQGQQALNQTRVNEVYNAAGGADAYQELIGWAEDALEQDQIDAYNAVVARGNQAEILLAVEGLKAKFAATGKAPALVKDARSSATTAEAPFNSTAEMVAAMSDPKYKVDPAYRALVERRLAKSDIMG